jgi:hypothetical protein
MTLRTRTGAGLFQQNQPMSVVSGRLSHCRMRTFDQRQSQRRQEVVSHLASGWHP